MIISIQVQRKDYSFVETTLMWDLALLPRRGEKLTLEGKGDLDGAYAVELVKWNHNARTSETGLTLYLVLPERFVP